MSSLEPQPPAQSRRPSALDDLLATHESAPRVARPGPRAVGRKPKSAAAPTGEPRSLFGEILDWMLAPLLLMWPLSIGFTFIVARSLADAPFDRALIDHANVLVRQVQIVDDHSAVRNPRGLRGLLGAGTEDTLFFQIAKADGALLAGEPAMPPPALYDFPAPGRIKLRMDQFHGQEVRVAYTYLDHPDESAGGGEFPVLVQIAETLDARVALANEIIKGVIIPQFVILPLAVALVWFGLSRGLAPLNQLQQRIRARRPDDISPIDPRGAPEEIAPLVAAFNEVLGRLDASFGTQKRFIADAAHQMKTPLAGLRTQAELALRESEPEELRHRLEQLAISSDRAAHLISQLLSLARMENLRDSTPRHAIDLAPLARSVASDWALNALELGIDFGFESDDTPAPIAGEPVLLREMFGNLIDNALRYTPRGGTVTARLRSGTSQVEFEVEDSGPGIPAAERELVFERFYRVLGSNIDGSGLGLAIVREIADQHGASVAILDGRCPDGPCGTRMVVSFPKLAEVH